MKQLSSTDKWELFSNGWVYFWSLLFHSLLPIEVLNFLFFFLVLFVSSFFSWSWMICPFSPSHRNTIHLCKWRSHPTLSGSSFSFFGWVINLAQPVILHYPFVLVSLPTRLQVLESMRSGVSKLHILGFISIHCSIYLKTILTPSETKTGQKADSACRLIILLCMFFRA